jgi:hypothetical protein
MAYTIDSKTGESKDATQKPADIKTNAQVPMSRWEQWNEWSKVAVKAGVAIVAVVKLAGAAVAASAAGSQRVVEDSRRRFRFKWWETEKRPSRRA